MTLSAMDQLTIKLAETLLAVIEDQHHAMHARWNKDGLSAALIAARTCTPEANGPPPWPPEAEPITEALAAKHANDAQVRETAAELVAAGVGMSVDEARRYLDRAAWPTDPWFRAARMVVEKQKQPEPRDALLTYGERLQRALANQGHTLTLAAAVSVAKEMHR